MLSMQDPVTKDDAVMVYTTNVTAQKEAEMKLQALLEAKEKENEVCSILYVRCP